MENLPSTPEHSHFQDALSHIHELINSNSIPTSTAKGLIYSVVETLGTIVGDPDLPAHALSGYEGVLEYGRELQAKLDSLTK
jgi:hypothetical protein